jgi:hypothetical protein
MCMLRPVAWLADKAVDLGRIATELYSRRSRFLLELIQNVEDCGFQYTQRRPSITFEVNPREIIVTSNQDGFIERDVSYICRTGRSWKRGISGYVGDKGIGFKSVFKVASKVEIQSNAFSFFFAYNGEEDAEKRLGMITPIVGLRRIPPEDWPLTKMILTLKEEILYDDLISDFEAIPKEILLFLSKLKEISFKIYSLELERTVTTTFGISTGGDEICIITKRVEQSSSPQIWRYIVRKSQALQLPSHPARLGINQCDTVLAFPIQVDGSPGAHTQYDIYAFLPVCSVGFNVSFVEIYQFRY